MTGHPDVVGDVKEALQGATSAFDFDEYKQAWDEIVQIANEFTDGAYESFGISRDASIYSLFTASTSLVLASMLLLTIQ